MSSIIVETKINRFSAFRERLNISQEEAAKMLHVTTTTWNCWETGKTFPKGPALALLEQLEATVLVNPPLTYAQKCSKLRELLSVSKAEMARRFNVLSNTWINWERGAKPGLDERQKIDQMLAEIELNTKPIVETIK